MTTKMNLMAENVLPESCGSVGLTAGFWPVVWVTVQV